MYLIYIFLEKPIYDHWTETCKRVPCQQSQLFVCFVVPKFVIHPCAILIYH